MENKLQNAIVIFSLENGQYTLDNIKQLYRKLASMNHPDKGGNTETMQLINTAFTEFCRYFETNQTLDINQNHDIPGINFEFLNTLKSLQGLVIEVCGYWVWLSGDSYTHREIIKNLGFKFSGSKKRWYWSPTIDDIHYCRGNKSMKQIRKQYGSQIIETELQAVLN